MSETRSVTLSRPVQAHGEEVRVLQFREPTGADAWECGLPLRWSSDNELVMGMQPMMSLAARLAGVPLSTIKALPLPDVMAVVGVITSFLGGSPATAEPARPDAIRPSGPSTSPGSTDAIRAISLRSA